MGKTPKLAIIGGRLETDNAAVFAELRRLSGGRIAILATASGEPDEVAAETAELFASHGMLPAIIPIHGPGAPAAAQDARVAAALEACGSAYFTGGDQALITGAFLPGGQKSPAFWALERMVTAGGLLAGSSAGAACLSGPMILGGSSVQALVHGVTDDPEQPGMMMGTGLGFFPHGLIDQHFIKRGRLGRLLVGMAASGTRWGFGVDENTALVVEGTDARVVGEYGVMLLDRGEGAPGGPPWEGLRLSYLDNGDGLDLATMQPRPAKAKRRLRAGAHSWRAPAASRRNAFGPYALYELMVRLAEGDRSVYDREVALAYDPSAATAARLTLVRERKRTLALAARRRDGSRRHTILDMRLDVALEKASRAEWLRHRTAEPRGLSGGQVAPGARLVVTGSSPLTGHPALLDGILANIRGPVGVIAAASADPADAARDYVETLRRRGVEAEDLGIHAAAMPQLMADAGLLERVASKRAILFTGGDQTRLVETLLHRGAETPVLGAVMHVYQAGGALVAVSGAASALSGIMIAGGGSWQAIRYGVAADAGHAGLLLEEGFGLFDLGIVDQNIIDRNRLGRLVVACAEENARFGFGVCEDSAMVVHGGGTEIEAIGRTGIVLAELEPEKLTLQGDSFAAKGVVLSLVRPGSRFDLLGSGPPATAEDCTRRLEDLVAALERECWQAARERGLAHTTHIHVAMRRAAEGRVVLDIESDRAGAD